MKKLLLSSLAIALANTSYALQPMNDDSLSEMTGQTGIDLKIAAKVDVENFYFETNGNRLNMGNISLDTDSRNNGLSNEAFNVTIDAINEGYRQGLEMLITDVNALSVTVNDLSLSQYDDINEIDINKTVFGAIGIENINFNGGQALLSLTSRASMGNQGLEVGLSLPDATTLDFTINDFETIPDGAGTRDIGGELRADIELNGFSLVQTIDIVQLGDDENGEDQGAGLLFHISEFEASIDVRNLTAGNQTSHLGSYGRVFMDGLHMKRGYVIVDAL